MASLSDETLHRILQQIQQTAVNSQRALATTRATLAAKERERRILQLTIEEINSLDKDVNFYKGVGKMFMLTPHPTMEKDLKAQEKDLTDDLNNLNKKAKYLEKTFNEAQAQLRDIFSGAPQS
ncbi:hypothetical protein ACEPAF_4072 [Sanghuangporus sanghuang]|uniref:Prefoldin beta-like protein n=1 Tax=Sanghuangporus baumii TaxID=108892 RepID=A0A9Q5HZS7_SANBA|nr:Prefoldin beta-like protein [Sanghuangporus baumii]